MQRERRNVHMKVLKSQTSPDGSNPGVTSAMFVKVFVSSGVAVGIRIYAVLNAFVDVLMVSVGRC